MSGSGLEISLKPEEVPQAGRELLEKAKFFAAIRMTGFVEGSSDTASRKSGNILKLPHPCWAFLICYTPLQKRHRKIHQEAIKGQGSRPLS